MPVNQTDAEPDDNEETDVDETPDSVEQEDEAAHEVDV
jgi:hypothetical protein